MFICSHIVRWDDWGQFLCIGTEVVFSSASQTPTAGSTEEPTSSQTEKQPSSAVFTLVFVHVWVTSGFRGGSSKMPHAFIVPSCCWSGNSSNAPKATVSGFYCTFLFPMLNERGPMFSWGRYGMVGILKLHFFHQYSIKWMCCEKGHSWGQTQRVILSLCSLTQLLMLFFYLGYCRVQSHGSHRSLLQKQLAAVFSKHALMYPLCAVCIKHIVSYKNWLLLYSNRQNQAWRILSIRPTGRVKLINCATDFICQCLLRYINIGEYVSC